MFHSNPQHLNLHAWCLGVDSSKNKASLWNCCPSKVINKDHLQVKVGPIWDVVQRKFSGFLHSLWEKVSDFFLYLYQDLNRCTSTIDGYRTAIVDTLGPAGLHISQSSDLNRLLSSIHRDCPKSSRNLPKWNLSVGLNELTKAPFEPMKDTDLKHLTLKTAFLLALASSKHHSEIYAWVANKVSNLGQWEKVALFPSSDFIAKKPTSKRRFLKCASGDSLFWIKSLDRQLKEDRTLCPLRALRYYLDRTKDLRGSQSLLFISFKKGHTSNISDLLLSSWSKQTILLCYKQADQQFLDLV